MEVVRFHAQLTWWSHQAQAPVEAAKPAVRSADSMAPPVPTPTMGQGASLGGAYKTPAYVKYSPQLAYGRDSEDDEEERDEEADDEPEEERAGRADVADDSREGWLDVGSLIQAMGKCNQVYDEHDRTEFYGMVAEEYYAMHPNCHNLSIETIELNEVALRRYALAALSGSSEDLQVPHDVKRHESELIGFYKVMTEVGRCQPVAEAPRSEVTTSTQNPSNRPESPYGSVHSNAEQTDGSASNPTTPVVDESSGETQQPGTAEMQVSTSVGSETKQNDQETTVVVRSSAPAAAHSALTLSDPSSGKIAYRHAMDVLADQTRARDESSERLRLVEERLKAERELVTRRKQEFKQLKAIVKSYRVRDKEKKRLAAAIENDRGYGDDGNGGRSLEDDRKALRKEIKRYKRLQETLTLKFQLLQSETKNHEMKIEREVAELKRECLDSYLFADGSLS